MLFHIQRFVLSRLAHFLIIVYASMLASCGGPKKVLVETPLSLPSLQESVVNIPLKLYATPYLKQAEKMAPLEFTSDHWPDYFQSTCDFRYKYRFIRSGLLFNCVNNKMTIAFAGNYQIAGSKTVCAFGKQVSPWITGSCGFGSEPMRRVKISIQSDLEFRPDYTLKTTTLPERVEAIDKCTVTIFNSDVTNEVIDSIGASVAAFGSYMDNTIAGLNFSGTLQTLASMVGKKLPLMDFGYIKINPSAVKAGRLNYKKDTLYFTLGLSCYPEISSDSGNISVTRFLPPLGTGDLPPGFHIHTNSSYAYPYISNLLTRFIKDRTFDLEGNQIQIREIQVRGIENHKLEFSIEFTGDKKGVLFLTGTPKLDVENQVIALPDLDYSLSTGNVALNVGKTLFNKKIITMMRQKAVLKINDMYHENKASLDSALNRKLTSQISSSGQTDEIKITGLLVQKDNLLFQVSLKGLLTLIVKE